MNGTWEGGMAAKGTAASMRLGAAPRGGEVAGDGVHLPLLEHANPTASPQALRVDLLLLGPDAGRAPELSASGGLVVPGGEQLVLGIALTGSARLSLAQPATALPAVADERPRCRVVLAPEIANRGEQPQALTLHVTSTPLHGGRLGTVTSEVRVRGSLDPGRSVRPVLVVEPRDEEVV